MTICHVTSMHPFNDDRIFERACKGLNSIGDKVILIATHDGDIVIDGIGILGLKKRKGLSRRILSSFEAFRKARTVKADVFHFHDPDLIPWMLILSFLNRKVVYDVHENYESRAVKLPPLFLRKVYAKIYRKLENMLSSGFSGLTVVTPSMKNLFRGVNKPIEVTDNVVYVSRLKDVELPAEKNKKLTIYTSGTNSKYRNCLQTIDALPHILREVPDIRMMFAGRYYPEDYRSLLNKRAEDLGVSEYVSIEGMMSWEENFKRTAGAHIGCVFYEDNLNNRVTLPNRLYEYMFCGVAVLGEDFPEVRRVLEDSGAGLCVNSNSPESIAGKAIYMLKNPDVMIEMGRKGREAVLKKYNFENELMRLDQFYKKIAGNGGQVA
ncbi:MAG: glycosyltransferase [Ignavibacteriae bacterium]|nr:glycosyltransferase [Ignavibacteriota bacterium]MCB9244053.1 glycosyltransferase [Ignavibacteriales bacterium]